MKRHELDKFFEWGYDMIRRRNLDGEDAFMLGKLLGAASMTVEKDEKQAANKETA